MREWRRSHPLKGEALRRARIRSHTKMLIRRGKIRRAPCCSCGASPASVHHVDYTLEDAARRVAWLCDACHRALHRGEPVRVELAAVLPSRRWVSYAPAGVPQNDVPRVTSTEGERMP